MQFPRMVKIRQALYGEVLPEVGKAVQRKLAHIGLAGRVRPGMKVAITAGSRGIAGLPEVLEAIVIFLKSQGAKPFIIPAMGSHGGATAEGQVKILASLGVTEERIGAPICFSMEVVKIGEIGNATPVYMDALAAQADGIIVVNRVKEHTDFAAPLESGLMKMLTVGLGKRAGAGALHALGWEQMPENIALAGRLILAKAPVLCGVAIMENAYQGIAKVRVFRPEQIEKGERRLLQQVKRHAPRLPFKELDILVVERLGKDISGAGLDPNVTGRFAVPVKRPGGSLKCYRIAVLGLTAETEGNAVGIGVADIITQRCAQAIDIQATYANALTSGNLMLARIPLTLENDQAAIAAALTCGFNTPPQQVRLVRIGDTLHLDTFYISEGLLEEVENHPALTIIGKPQPMRFDKAGNLVGQ